MWVNEIVLLQLGRETIDAYQNEYSMLQEILIIPLKMNSFVLTDLKYKLTITLWFHGIFTKTCDSKFLQFAHYDIKEECNFENFNE